MARLFRFLEKKRGQRRTGSNLVGGVGEALMYGGLLLVGVALRLLDIKQVKVGDLLPALLVAPLLTELVVQVR